MRGPFESVTFSVTLSPALVMRKHLRKCPRLSKLSIPQRVRKISLSCLPENLFQPTQLMKLLSALLFSVMLGVLSSSARAQEKTIIRFGHFPNTLHAQGVIVHGLSRQAKG